jgi:hypothetical protein
MCIQTNEYLLGGEVEGKELAAPETMVGLTAPCVIVTECRLMPNSIIPRTLQDLTI